MTDNPYLPGHILSLAAEAADRLVASGSGDAALLYLYLMKNGGVYRPEVAAKALRWEGERCAGAHSLLCRLSLAQPVSQPAPLSPAEEPPEYTSADITRELENKASPFPALVAEVQKLLGKVLSTNDLKCLYTIYDYTGLPAEVILLAVSWTMEEYRRKYGPSRMPRMPQIQREAIRWKEQGVDTVEGAEAHLKRLTQLRDRSVRILALLDSPGAAWLVTEMDGSGWRMGTFDRAGGLRGLDVPMERLEPLLGSRGMLEEGETALYAEPLTRAGTVYLFGGGHVARELAHILAMTDFRVAVCDQRKQAVSRTYFPEASSLLCCPFEEALERTGPVTAEDYVVIMTPGHQGDYEVLRQALRTPARYIGCIGSRKKVAVTRERLLAEGFTGEDIGRVHAPIGLPIGGETPAEVAVSVAAQLIACRSGRLEAFR